MAVQAITSTVEGRHNRSDARVNLVFSEQTKGVGMVVLNLDQGYAMSLRETLGPSRGGVVRVKISHHQFDRSTMYSGELVN
jgi:hypothetical protein